MSNLRSSGHLPLKTPMTNKWKSQAPTSDLLERQTRALEESLNKLKIAMHPEKAKSNTEANGPIWDKGKTGPMTQYANHVLRDDSRRIFDASKPTRVRVLGDEPAVPVVRPSLVANLFSTKPSTNSTKTIRCGQCEKDEAKMKCMECAESYCAGCFADFHLRGALQRHRYVPLIDGRPRTPQKKKAPVGADVIFKELRHAQSKDDLLRKSNMTSNYFESNSNNENDDDEEEYSARDGGQLLDGNYDEKTSAASFQQALMQWRQKDAKIKRPGHSLAKKRGWKKKTSTHEAAVDTVHDANGTLNQTVMPQIEFHSSKLTYGEKLLLKKYRRANKNNQDFFTQRGPKDSSVRKSLPIQNFQIESLYDDVPSARPEESARIITAEHEHIEDQEEDEEELLRLKEKPNRNKSRASTRPVSRPNSAAMRKDSLTSRPNSVALFQHPLPSLLATNPSDEFRAVVDSQPSLSRPSSAALKKPTKLDYRLQTMWNRNWKPEQSVADGIDPHTIVPDQLALTQFDLALDDLLDESKIESASRTNAPVQNIDYQLTALRQSTSARSETNRNPSRISNVGSPTPREQTTLRPSTSTQSEKNRNPLRMSDVGSPTPRQQTELRQGTSAHSEKNRDPPRISDVGSPTPRQQTESRQSTSARSEKNRNPSRMSDVGSPTPRQMSALNFSSSSQKTPRVDSSMDAADAGFFTDVMPRQQPVAAAPSPSPPTPVVERSATAEWKQLLANRSARSSVEERRIIPNLLSLRKASIESFPRAPPKRGSTLDEHPPGESHSRPTSSLSSSSLPVSVTSSKPDFITQPSIERHPKVPAAPPPTATKKFRVEFPKKSSTPAVPPMVIEGKKVTSARDIDDQFQQSTSSIKSSKLVPTTHKSQSSTTTMLKGSPSSSITSITRDDNLLRDESITITDVPGVKASTRRSATINNEMPSARKLEFNMRDGTKWQAASIDSTARVKGNPVPTPRRSSKANTPRPKTPTNTTNSKLGQQFSMYDNDDGRSSRMCQDVKDEECFNQLREELCSELNMTSPGWDASLSEHVLKNLRGTEVRFSEKELQDNLTMLEMKLRENESLQRSPTDDDLLSHEEVRNL